MSSMNDPFDSDLPLSHCSCGKHASQAEHDEEMAAREHYRLQLRLVEPEPRRMHAAATPSQFAQLATQSGRSGSRTRTLH
jgi:hypothetical protein